MPRTDLNLLLIFDAIMQEQSITAAADRLAMTQPSVSNAVARMRHQWQDPLFVKQGRGLKATPYAEQLWQQTRLALGDIQQALQSEPFVPARSQRTFRVALSDGMGLLLWPRLNQLLEREAPGINLHAVPFQANGETLLQQAEVDLVADYYAGRDNQIEQVLLFDNPFVCLHRPDHPLAQQPLTLEDYLHARHLLVSLTGHAQGAVDRYLQQQGLARRIAVTINSFASVPLLLAQSNLITTLPYPVMSQWVEQGILQARPLPFPLGGAPISLAWHRRHQRDQGLAWLRQQIQQLCQQQQMHWQQALDQLQPR